MDTERLSAQKLFDEIIKKAIEENASDIHIEPLRDNVRVRFRIHGEIKDFCFLSHKNFSQFIIKTKVSGHMDVGEKRLFQDGRGMFKISNDTYDLRFSIIPSLYGEATAIRILPEKLSFIDDFKLGMTEKQEEIFKKCLLKKSGLILTSGATGSGKTSTLYAALKFLARENLHILSIEDPIEYKIEGITQVEVNEKANLTFENGLRAFVRHDPDVIMVGEIRDVESAKIALHAALTGHLVLSSIHTEKVGKVPYRLTDMGVDPKVLSEALTLIISQKLIEKKNKEKEIIGRIGAFEMLYVNEEVRSAVRNGEKSDKFDELIKKQGLLTLDESVMFHVKKTL